MKTIVPKMKRITATALLFAGSLFLYGCTGLIMDAVAKIDPNGLTPEINRLISPQLLENLEDMGMTIHRGGNPPSNITGKYLCSPTVCKATNVPGDAYGPGTVFKNYYFTFSEQNIVKLTIKVSSSQDGVTGTGFGSYMVGEGDNFSIFCPMEMVTPSGHRYKTLDIFSGTIASNGIINYHQSTVMLEGGGTSWGLLSVGQGRVIFDGDFLAEKLP